jgi:putative glutamine amidotransferase
MRPRIGISLELDERGHRHSGRERLQLDARYARAIDEAGGLPLLLPVQDDPDALAAAIDGLLLPGGGDFVPPHPYPATVAFEPVSAAQLEFDRRLLDHALERRLPVLGICYGMQLLAVHHGGTLHYDIATDRPEAGLHRLPEPEGRHPVELARDGRLAGLLGAERLAVNSRHHQAVAEPGSGLRVAARAPDGIVEAIEAVDGPFCVAVQWHPERLDAAHRRALFGGFVAACREAGGSASSGAGQAATSSRKRRRRAR